MFWSLLCISSTFLSLSLGMLSCGIPLGLCVLIRHYLTIFCNARKCVRDWSTYCRLITLTVMRDGVMSHSGVSIRSPVIWRVTTVGFYGESDALYRGLVLYPCLRFCISIFMPCVYAVQSNGLVLEYN